VLAQHCFEKQQGIAPVLKLQGEGVMTPPKIVDCLGTARGYAQAFGGKAEGHRNAEALANEYKWMNP